MPLSARPLPETEWHAYLPPIWMGEPTRRLVYRPRADGLPERIAEGFERVATIPAELPGPPLGWSERGWVVRSLRPVRACEVRLRPRCARAQAESQALHQWGRAKRRFGSRHPLRQAAEAIGVRPPLTGLFQLTYPTSVSPRRVRAEGQRPARGVKAAQHPVRAAINETALNETIRALGWHVSATHADVARLALEHAVLADRQGDWVEHGHLSFVIAPYSSRVMNSPLSTFCATILRPASKRTSARISLKHLPSIISLLRT